jgi:hypothetical protein
MCVTQRVKELMGFRQDWNKEIIAQFCTTIHFVHVDDERAMQWMTNGNKYVIRCSRFLSPFGLEQEDKDYPSFW